MGVAGGEIAIWRREARILLDRKEQFRHGFIEAPSQEMRLAYQRMRRTNAGARTEPQRGLGVLDREVRVAREKPEDTADVPTSRKIRVEREGTIDQRYHCVDVLAEIGQGESGIDNNVRIVTGDFQGSLREIDSLAAVPLGVGARAIYAEPVTAHRGPGEGRPITRIARDRLLQ